MSTRLRVGVCLSLSGRFARFGTQAAMGLQVWRSLDGAADLIIEDDHSDPRRLAATLPEVAGRCDVLLGPYSTRLMRVAGDIAADTGRVIWNHGGSGDDVEGAHPGHIVSVLTPASRYADPFLRRLARVREPRTLFLAHGRGSFGRQVTAGAETTGRALGIDTVRLGPQDDLPAVEAASGWSLFCAGLFEEDTRTVTRALALPNPPEVICAVAAGIREFGLAVPDPEGIFGVGQWAPHSGRRAEIGPSEGEFLAAYAARTGALPDYPAVQTAATAALATHCARTAGGTSRDLTWPAASELDTSTLFGRFTIDPLTGIQTGHEATLVRWAPEGPAPV